MLNGFGDARRDRAAARRLADEYRRRGRLQRRRHVAGRPRSREHGRAMRRASSARSTSWSTTPASSTPRRSTSFPAETLGRDHRDQPLRRVPHHQGGAAADAGAGWGRIINIASAHGLVASPKKAAYVAAKHGLVGLTKVVALETAQHRHHLQRHLPRLGADPAGAEADRRRAPRAAKHLRSRQAKLASSPRSSRRSSSSPPSRSAQLPSSCARAPPAQIRGAPIASTAAGPRSD